MLFLRKKKVAVCYNTAGPDYSGDLGKESQWERFQVLVNFSTAGSIHRKWKTNESNICSCLIFSADHQGVSFLLTVRLTVSSGSEKPVTHHAVMSTFLPVLVQVLPMLTFLFRSGTSRCFFPSDLALLLLKTLQFASCLPEIAFFTIPCYLWSIGIVIHFLSQYLSILMSIVHVFWIRHLSWKRFNNDSVVCHQGGLDLEEKVICFNLMR